MDNTEAFTHLSLCAGYGGIDLGLKRVLPGLRTGAYVEREAFAAANLVAKVEEGKLDLAPIYGRTLAPSHTAIFTDEWTSSLADVHVNLFQLVESDAPATTSVISSPSLSAESLNVSPPSSSSKTSKACSVPATEASQFLTMSSVSLSTLATLQRPECFLRTKSARRMNASASSSWPTPTATLAKQSRNVSAPSLLDRVLMEEFGLPHPAKNPESARLLALLRKRYELNPEWVEMLMGIPRDWTKPL